MTAFSNDVYMAGHPRPRNLVQARGHAGRRGRAGGSVGAARAAGASEFAEGDLLRPWNYHINYRVMNPPECETVHAPPCLCRGFGYG